MDMQGRVKNPRKKMLLVYPQQGFSGIFVRHAPLSLLYASAELVKDGMPVQILDTRLFPETWEEELRQLLSPDVVAVGISVMSGRPIASASAISRYVKSVDPAIKIVWGGPHATFYPESILNGEPDCDYVVSGYGSRPLKELMACMTKGKVPNGIQGVSYRGGGQIRQTPYEKRFEHIHYSEIPYHLIKDYSVYGQLDSKKRIFSLYSVYGCPYKCAFCSSPAHYNGFGKRWVTLPVEEVVDHIEHVVQKYRADYIYFIDDDSFVDLKHVEGIIDLLFARKIQVKLGFRGARINELKKMSGGFIDKLIRAGTDIMHVGVESGSDRILKLIRKDCTVDDIIAVNHKLARHPGIMAGYNFIIGIPTETMEDLKATKNLMLRLVADNPSCIIFQPNKFRPLPGTELFDIVSREWGYEAPKKLVEWAEMEAEGDFSAGWYTPRMKKYCDMLLIGSYFIDGKVFKVTTGEKPFYRIIRFLSRLYTPIIRFRLKHDLYGWLLEYRIYKILTKIIARHSISVGAK